MERYFDVRVDESIFKNTREPFQTFLKTCLLYQIANFFSLACLFFESEQKMMFGNLRKLSSGIAHRFTHLHNRWGKNRSCCSQNLSIVKNILEAYDPEKMPSFLLI